MTPDTPAIPDMPHRPRRTAAQRGFTLLEMLLTIVIMMIAASMVVPMFGTSDSVYVSAGVALMVADLDYAQATAINDPTDDVAVHFDTVAGRWWLTPAADPATTLTMSNGEPYDTTMGVGRADLAIDVTIALSGVVGNEFSYDAYGRLSQTDNAVITLARGSSRAVITIDAEMGFLTAQ